MSATVVPLFTPKAPPAAAPQPLGLVDELRRVAAASLQKRLDTVFQRAADLLSGLAERSASADERGVVQEAQRLLQRENGAIARRFIYEVVAPFNPQAGAAEAEIEWSDDLSEERDEQITLINLASRIKQLHAARLAELRRRLTLAARSGAQPVSPQALSARGIAFALVRSLITLQVDFPTRMVLYRVFDGLMVGAMGPVYDDVLARLTRYCGAETAPAPAAADNTVLPHLSPETVRALQAVDTPYAHELLAIVHGKIVAGGSAVRQRLALAGWLADQAAQQVGDDQARLDLVTALRYPLMVAALTDSTFFSRPEHSQRLRLQAALRGTETDDTAPAPAAEASALTALRMIEALSPAEIAAFRGQLEPSTRAAAA